MTLEVQVGIAIIIEKKGKILVGKRTSRIGKDLWECPSGRIEVGENIIEGLHREAKEELSIEVTDQTLIHAYLFHRAEKPMLLLNYYCEFNGEIKKSLEHSQLKWINYIKISEYLIHKEQLEVIKKLLKIKNCF